MAKIKYIIIQGIFSHTKKLLRRKRSIDVSRFKKMLEEVFEKTSSTFKSTSKSTDRLQELLLVGVAIVVLDRIIRKEYRSVQILRPVINNDLLDKKPKEADKLKHSDMVGTSFDLYAPKLSKLEGGKKFTNRKSDLGGATYHGVTLKTFRRYFGENMTEKDLKNMTDSQWRQIMISFWNICKADYMINQSVAELIVDWAINSGPYTAITGVQKLVNVTPDGVIGDKTLAAINNANQSWLFSNIKSARIQYYHNLVSTRPNQKVNLQGWLNRVNSFSFVEQDYSSYPIRTQDVLVAEAYQFNGSGALNKQ